MSAPDISIVIPAYNEEAGIDNTISQLTGYLEDSGREWELIVVNDGSEDGTASLTAARAAQERRIRLVDAPHRGKGSAVRRGMIEAKGRYRFLCDTDLSMPPEQIERFFGGPDGAPGYDVSIGSREAAGARRIGEPWWRHFIGRVFNWWVRIAAVRNIQDSQCGFKLFSAPAAEAVFRLQRLDGWAFDVELLFLARKAGFTIGEVPIDWRYDPDSRVSLIKGGFAFLDILKIRLNDILGRYSTEPTDAGHRGNPPS